MLRKIILIVSIIVFLVFGARRGWHQSYIDYVKSDIIMAHWLDKFQVQMISEFGPLPEDDRILIKKRCEPIFVKISTFRGTKERLNPKLEPVCQTLIRSGWNPDWTVNDGFEKIKINALGQ